MQNYSLAFYLSTSINEPKKDLTFFDYILQIEEIAYMMLKPAGKIMTRNWPLTVLPVGFTIPFVVTYHNNIGQVFDAVRSQLQYRASR